MAESRQELTKKSRTPHEFIKSIKYKPDINDAHFKHKQILTIFVDQFEKSAKEEHKETIKEEHQQTLLGAIHLIYWLIHLECTFLSARGTKITSGSRLLKEIEEYLKESNFTYDTSIGKLGYVYRFLDSNPTNLSCSKIKNNITRIEKHLKKWGKGSWTPDLSTLTKVTGFSWLTSKSKDKDLEKGPDDKTWRDGFARVTEHLYENSESIHDVKYRAVREHVADEKVESFEQRYHEKKKADHSLWNKVKRFLWEDNSKVAALFTFLRKGMEAEKKKREESAKKELTEGTSKPVIQFYPAELGLATLFQMKIEKTYAMPWWIWGPTHSITHEQCREITGRYCIDEYYLQNETKEEWFDELLRYFNKCRKEIKMKQKDNIAISNEERLILELLPELCSEVSKLMLDPSKDEQRTAANTVKQKTKYVSEFFINTGIYKTVASFIPDQRTKFAAAGVVVGKITFGAAAAAITLNPFIINAASTAGGAAGYFVGEAVGGQVPALASGPVIAGLSRFTKRVSNAVGDVAKGAINGVIYVVEGGIKLVFETDDPELNKKLSEEFNQEDYQEFINALAILPSKSAFTDGDKERLKDTHIMVEEQKTSTRMSMSTSY